MTQVNRNQLERRVRFKNKTNRLQVLYNEHGEKFELIPNGTILLTPTWANRYGKILAVVEEKVKPEKPAKTPDATK